LRRRGSTAGVVSPLGIIDISLLILTLVQGGPAMRAFRFASNVVMAGMALAVVLALAPRVYAQGNPNPGIIPPNAQYPELSADWWQWALTQPVSSNPLFDTTGADASNNQPTNGNIFYLAGLISLNAGLNASVERTITIPPGKRLFFPILNSEADIPSSVLGSTTVPQLRAEAAFFVDQIQSMFLTIDGKNAGDLTAYRTISPVFGFVLPPQDNIYQFFGLNISGLVYPAVADGYYVLLAPLPPGKHTILFGGTTKILDQNGQPAIFSLKITYHITVAPR
jgi:hypothetical protein